MRNSDLRVRVTPPAGQRQSIDWSWHSRGGSFTPSNSHPPTGPDALEWDLGDILNPAPGPVDINVVVRYTDGSCLSGRYSTEIGVRTDDVIVVGWIKKDGVTLPTTGVTPFWTTMLPPNGPPVPSSYNCNWTVFRLSECDLSPHGQSLLTAPIDRNYILFWLFKYGGNVDPTVAIGGDFRDPTDTYLMESRVVSFRDTLTNYKLFSRFQIRYADLNWCAAQPTVLQAASLIGTTISPCGAWGLIPGQFPGQVGWLNRPPTIDCTPSPRLYVINDGSPDSGAVSAFHTLTGQSPPAGPSVFWENIGSNIRFAPDGSTSGTVTMQPYPTFYVYRNGRRVLTDPQAASPLGNFVTNPYPFGTVPCDVAGGITPGGRCGIATTPPDVTARVPDYIVP